MNRVGSMADRQRRVKKIHQLLQEAIFFSVQELSERLGVSSMTIRRDLDHLAELGLIQRLHGGAMWREPEQSLGQREHLHITEKTAIAEEALARIRPGETIALDSGTTTAKLAECIVASDIRPLTVITHALNVATILMADPRIHVHVAGGDLRPGTASLIGPRCRRFFQEVHVERAFMTAAGVTRDEGLTNSNFSEAEIKSAMREAADEVHVLVDGSKWGQRSMVSFAHLTQVHEIISDLEIDLDWTMILHQAGVRFSRARTASHLLGEGLQ